MAYLFVYGTLRHAVNHPMHQIIASYGSWVGEGVFQGKLYRISFYPGVVVSTNADDRVVGEVYHLHQSSEALEALDEYEGYDSKHENESDYLRRRASIAMNDGTALEAWIYLFNLPVERLDLIPSGDFLKP